MKTPILFLIICLAALPAWAGREAVVNASQEVVAHIEANNWQTYKYKAGSAEAMFLGSVLRRAGVKCPNVLRGTIYPFKSRSGFDSDVVCPGEKWHQVNMQQHGEKTELYVDGERVIYLPSEKRP